MTPHWARKRDFQWMRDVTDPDKVRIRTMRTREIAKTRRVSRGAGPASLLSERAEDLGPTLVGDGSRTVEDVLAESEADGFIVLHRGAVVYERYLNGLTRREPHLLASQTKVFVGLLAAVFAAEGLIDRRQRSQHYVPDLAGTAFGEATLDELLHMQTRPSYAGQRYDHQRESQRLHSIMGYLPFPQGYQGPATVREWLGSATAVGPAGETFRYENGNTEAVAWVLTEVSGQTLAELVSERIWAPIGAEEDAEFVIDDDGVEMASGGLAVALRDMARFGEMLRCGGHFNGRQIVPQSVAAGITVDAPPRAQQLLASSEFGASNPGVGYHDYFWIENDAYGSFQAHGKHVQRLHVSPGAETVFAQFGSFPGAGLDQARRCTTMYGVINERLAADA